MKLEVTGCKDCPMYDKTGSEYRIWCHHPERPIKVERYSGVPAYFLETDLPKEQVERLRKSYRKNGERWVYDMSVEREGTGPQKGDFLISECDIISDEKYEAITPDWCPLKHEPITIELIKV